MYAQKKDTCMSSMHYRISGYLDRIKRRIFKVKYFVVSYVNNTSRCKDEKLLTFFYINIYIFLKIAIIRIINIQKKGKTSLMFLYI